MIIRENSFEIRPVTPADLPAVLEVYRLCEDFLALGPVATASMQMVLKDIEISKGEGGLFCSLHNAAWKNDRGCGLYSKSLSGRPPFRLSFVAHDRRTFSQPGHREGGRRRSRLRSKKIRITTIFLGAQVNNPRAVQFWQKGYRIIAGPNCCPIRRSVTISKRICPGKASYDMDILANEISHVTWRSLCRQLCGSRAGGSGRRIPDRRVIVIDGRIIPRPRHHKCHEKPRSATPS